MNNIFNFIVFLGSLCFDLMAGTTSFPSLWNINPLWSYGHSCLLLQLIYAFFGAIRIFRTTQSVGRFFQNNVNNDGKCNIY